MSMFAKPPAPSSGIQWADHKGALLLIEPISESIDVPTSYGVTDAVKANVDVLDGLGAGERYDETLIFPKLLCAQTRRAIGQRVLGRLGQGNAKPGQSAPWILEEATPSDERAAEAWLARSKPIVPPDPGF